MSFQEMPITYQFQKNYLQKNIIIIKKIDFQDFPTTQFCLALLRKVECCHMQWQYI